jgi:hypothetical protein
MLARGKKFPSEEGSVKWHAVMMQQPVLLSPDFGAKFSHISMHLPYNVTAVCRIDCLACQDEFVVNNSLDVKKNYEHALDFFFHPSRLIWSW